MKNYADHCPLCGVIEVILYVRDKKRGYLHCPNCDLVFVPSEYHLNCEEEKGEYDLHQNDSNDSGYRKFLERILQPVLSEIPENSSGLDFGCGPGPTLSKMFEEYGHKMEVYDIYFFPSIDVLDKHFDFITSSEVVEHLAKPMDVFYQLWKMLLPGGVLGVMTKRVLGKEEFSRWHYKNDPTHIAFYSDTTAQWVARKLGAKLDLVGDDVFLLHKK